MYFLYLVSINHRTSQIQSLSRYKLYVSDLEKLILSNIWTLVFNVKFYFIWHSFVNLRLLHQIFIIYIWFSLNFIYLKMEQNFFILIAYLIITSKGGHLKQKIFFISPCIGLSTVFLFHLDTVQSSPYFEGY